MANWNLPTLTSVYQDVINFLKGRDDDLAKGLDPAVVTPSNLPEGAVRWNSANDRWEKKNSGGTFDPLSSKYMIDVDKLDGNHGSHFLNWDNFTNVPTVFPAASHNHDDRYYTESEADILFGASLGISGNSLQLRSKNGTAISSLTVGFATSAGNADTLDGQHASEFAAVGHGHTGLGASTWNGLRSTTQHGYIDFGPAHADYAHVYTDRPEFYFNKELQVSGQKVWNAGNDGASSGLDADLLDGQEGSFYRDASNLNAGTIPAAHALGTALNPIRIAASTDFNTLTTYGHYHCPYSVEMATCTNTPSAIVGHLTVERSTSSGVTQIWREYKSTGRVFVRQLYAGLWSNWEQHLNTIPELVKYNKYLTSDAPNGWILAENFAGDTNLGLTHCYVHRVLIGNWATFNLRLVVNSFSSGIVSDSGYSFRFDIGALMATAGWQMPKLLDGGYAVAQGRFGSSGHDFPVEALECQILNNENTYPNTFYFYSPDRRPLRSGVSTVATQFDVRGIFQCRVKD